MFWKRIAYVLLGFVVSSVVAHRDEAVAAVQAVAGTGGEPSLAHVDAAVESLFPVFLRPSIDAELQKDQAAALAALAQGAPAFIDHLIAQLKATQATILA